MKKIIVSALMILGAAFSFAGDAAAFVDLGISNDGKTYIFGEYGKTDKDFQSYAEIYVVDVAKNEFVNGGVFKTLPSAATASKSAKTVFDELKKKNASFLDKYSVSPVSAKNLIFTRELDSESREIVFQDFEGSSVKNPFFYNVSLIPTFEGKGDALRSSFYISMEKKDKDGTVLKRYIAGSPDVKRNRVSNYTINKIFTDNSGKNLVFIIEKTVQDKTGTSIRYMVETIAVSEAIGK